MKKVLCVLLTAFLLIGFSACDNAAKPSEPDSKPQSSSEQSSSDSEPEVKKELNQDLLSDIGLTYSQLVEKHGKLIKIVGSSGGYGYIFEKGYGNYDWSEEDIPNLSFLECDQNGNIKIDNPPLPKDGIAFVVLRNVKVTDLFPGLSLPTNINELENFQGLTVVSYGNTNETTDGNYWSTFLYNGIEISISTEEKGVLEPDSYIDVWA